MRPLIMGPAEKAALLALSDLASSRPVDITEVMRKVNTVLGKADHLRRMTEQTIELPLGYLVTYSIEENHPIGTARHLSISVHGTNQDGRLPNPMAVWTIAVELGFTGTSIEAANAVWLEKLKGHGQAINVVQVKK